MTDHYTESEPTILDSEVKRQVMAGMLERRFGEQAGLILTTLAEEGYEIVSGWHLQDLRRALDKQELIARANGDLSAGHARRMREAQRLLAHAVRFEFVFADGERVAVAERGFDGWSSYIVPDILTVLHVDRDAAIARAESLARPDGEPHALANDRCIADAADGNASRCLGDRVAGQSYCGRHLVDPYNDRTEEAPT